MGEEEDIRRVVEEVEREYGGISVLVNNAGIIRRRKGEEIKYLTGTMFLRLILVVLLFSANTFLKL